MSGQWVIQSLIKSYSLGLHVMGQACFLSAALNLSACIAWPVNGKNTLMDVGRKFPQPWDKGFILFLGFGSSDWY